MSADPPTTARGLTPREVAARLRVSPARVRRWVERGELKAVNTAEPLARTRLVILPEHLAEFTAKRSAATAAPVKPTRPKRRPAGQVDFFPGD